MRNDFQAKKGFIYPILIVVFFVFATWLVFQFDEDISMIKRIIVSLITFFPPFIFIWAYSNTHYWIQDNVLHYRSMFFKGSLEVSKIKKIETNTTMWTGMRPALAFGGMIISYNSYDQVYIAPNDQKAMIDFLLKINPNILIEEK